MSGFIDYGKLNYDDAIYKFSRIINKFPLNVEFIIAVGHQKEKIINFLEITHPKRKIKIVEVLKYQGKGSGPGYTLLQCEKYLHNPFIFVACDTLVEGKIPPPNKNWIGISSISEMIIISF